MKYSFLVFLVLFFVGCSTEQKQINLNAKPPKQYSVQPIQKKHIKPNAKGSLYTRQGTSLFADKKDLQIGDILQVNISESMTNDSSNKRSLKKSNTSALGGGVFSAANGVTQRAGTAKLMGRVNNAIGVGFNSTSSSTFSGTVATSNDEEFITVISVVIMDIYQNGNYFIQGSKELLINNQKQAIKLSGVIRPYDISPDNTVNSSQIANLKVLYEKAGDEQDTLEKPWGTKLLEIIWPF
ncbi:MAG TPA: flagellar basal body L-ring protein FlgH [Arcobacter sp.]|jgi:flagellar L-ring protein precursor FlgH|nr:flagellar basal body L-ring protein FlgH [Arcobacter sp.]